MTRERMVVGTRARMVGGSRTRAVVGAGVETGAGVGAGLEDFLVGWAVRGREGREVRRGSSTGAGVATRGEGVAPPLKEVGSERTGAAGTPISAKADGVSCPNGLTGRGLKFCSS